MIARAARRPALRIRRALLVAAVCVTGEVVAAPRVAVVRVQAEGAITSSVDKLRGQAEQAAARSDWHQARELLLRAAELTDPSAPLLLELGIALERTGSRPEAIDAFRRAVATDPGLVSAVENLAAAMTAAGDLEGALIVLRRGLQARPQAASLHYHLALLIFRREQGPAPSAVASLDRALALGYSQPHLYLLLARVARTSGPAAEAVALARKGLEQAPDDPELLRELGLALTALDDRHGAAEALGAALAAGPGDATTAADLGRALLSDDRAAEALVVLAEHASDDHPDIVYLLARAQQRLGLVEARETMRRFQALEAEETAARAAATRALAEVNAGVSRWNEGDPAAAVDHFERALVDRSGWPVARAYLAATRLELGEVAAAELLAEDLLTEDPTNAQALMVLGRARLARTPDEAFGLLEKAVTLYPFRIVCLLTLAAAYVDHGRIDDAGPILARVEEIEPDNPWLLEIRHLVGSRR